MKTSRFTGTVLAGFLMAILGGCSDGPESDVGGPAPTGRLVDLGGHCLHVECVGRGAPVVVFDPGIGATYRIYEDVIREISRDTCVCLYDRAGYGASEIGPFPRTAQQVAEELRVLLDSARIGPDCVLVGHSPGALHSLVFAASFPQRVSGLVLIDPPPLEFVTGRKFPDLWAMAQRRTQGFLTTAAEHRRAGRDKQAGHFQTLASEHEMMFSRSAERMAGIDSLADIPLIVIAAGKPNPAFGDEAAAFQAFWIESSRRLSRLSTRGAFVLAADAGHHVHVDAPETMIATIRRVIALARETKRAD
jgi:pimeloyl-ACP methyl ester carboxylesterase